MFSTVPSTVEVTILYSVAIGLFGSIISLISFFAPPFKKNPTPTSLSKDSDFKYNLFRFLSSCSYSLNLPRYSSPNFSYNLKVFWYCLYSSFVPINSLCSFIFPSVKSSNLFSTSLIPASYSFTSSAFLSAFSLPTSISFSVLSIFSISFLRSSIFVVNRFSSLFSNLSLSISVGSLVETTSLVPWP